MPFSQLLVFEQDGGAAGCVEICGMRQHIGREGGEGKEMINVAIRSESASTRIRNFMEHTLHPPGK